MSEKTANALSEQPKGHAVVFIVCGGVKISLEEMLEYKTTVLKSKRGNWSAYCNGVDVDIR